MEVFEEIEQQDPSLKTATIGLVEDDASNGKENENDDYHAHQSRVLQEQFGIDAEELPPTREPSHNNHGDVLTAIQKVKMRIQRRKEQNSIATQTDTFKDSDLSKKNFGFETQILKTTCITSTPSMESTQQIQSERLESIPLTQSIQTDSMKRSISLSTQQIQTGTAESVDQLASTQIIPAESDKRTTEGKALNTRKEDNDNDNISADDDDDETLGRSEGPLHVSDDGHGNSNKAYLNAVGQQTQVMQATGIKVITQKGAEQDSDEEMIRPKTRRNQDTSILESLFVDSDDDSDDEISKNIPGYASMSRDERLAARKLERLKLRDQKKLKPIGNEYLNTQEKLVRRDAVRRRETEKQRVLKKQQKLDAIRQNELLKKAFVEVKIAKPTKFSKDKLLHEFNLDSDKESSKSDDGIHQRDTISTIPTSPEKPVPSLPVTKMIKKKHFKDSEKLINLDSGSDSGSDDNYVHVDEDYDDPSASLSYKQKELDIKLKYAKKRSKELVKAKKATLADIIRKHNEKQLEEILKDKTRNMTNKEIKLTEEMLTKMLMEEQTKNARKLKKEENELRKLERQRRLLRDGKLGHDDSESSEYSSNYDISSNESDYDSDAELKKAEDIPSFKLTNTDAFKDFDLSMSKLADKEHTQREAGQLSTYDKFKKLKNAEDSSEEEVDDSVMEHKASFGQKSFLTEQLQTQSLVEDGPNDAPSEVPLKDLLDSQNLILETQVDAVDPCSIDQSTQVSPKEILDSKNNKVQQTESDEIAIEVVYENNKNGEKVREDNYEEASDVDDDEEEKIKIGRKSTILDKSNGNGTTLEAIFPDEETEEQRQMRAQLIKNARKKERQLARERKLKLKESGLSEMMEGEAVESEDEYQGIGGSDTDSSDDENSEDEKLIDDASNLEIDENEMRKLQLERELKEDEEKVAKTYKDVKTHKLAKRRAKNGIFDIELSDDDDEMDEMLKIKEFVRKRKLREQQELMERSRVKISDNDPKKPFFDAMAVNIPSHVSIYKDSFMNTLSELNDDDDSNDGEESRQEILEDEKLKEHYEYLQPHKKRKFNSVKSFQDDADFMYGSFQDMEADRLKRDVLSSDSGDDSDDGTQELRKLKRRTKVKLTRKLGVRQEVGAETEVPGSQGSLSILSNSTTSITASFKKATKKKVKISANTGNVIGDVTVTTTTRSVTNSKAAITRLASSESTKPDLGKRVVKGSEVDRLERMLAKSRKRGIRDIAQR